jgi:hypothetical protein
MVGCVCIRNPGAALTSQIAPPVSRTGSGDVGADEVDAGDVQPDHPGRLLGDLDVLRVRLERAVDGDATRRHVAGEGELDHQALGGDVGHLEALLADQPGRGVVDLDAGEHLLVADTAARVGVGRVDQLLDRAGAVAGDRGRHPLGDGGHPAVDDQAAVVLADDQRLHDDPPATGLALGDLERLADLVVVLEVQADPATVVAVEGLDHDRVADPVRRAHALVRRTHGLLFGDRQARRTEQAGREVLVGGDVDRDRAGLRGHRGADPLGMDALAELHEGVLVEPDPRDVARDGLVDDRLGRGAEGGALRAQDERLELAVPVELGVGLDEVVHQAYGELRRGQADLLVDVAEHHVVVPGHALDLAGLAAPDVVADHLLERQGGVLGDVAEPGALVEPLHETAAATPRAGVLPEAGQELEDVLGEGGDRVRRELLERAEVDDEVDGLLVGPDVRPAVDAGLVDRQVGQGTFGHEGAPSGGGAGVSDEPGRLRVRASRRRRTLGEASAAAMSRAIWRRSWLASAISSASAASWTRVFAGTRVRVVRSKEEPAGSTCSTTPLASSGVDRLAS